MAPRPVANQRFRQRKLSTRLALQVIKGEKELETLEGDQQSAPKVETGVEKHEETVSIFILSPFDPYYRLSTSSSLLPAVSQIFLTLATKNREQPFSIITSGLPTFPTSSCTSFS